MALPLHLILVTLEKLSTIKLRMHYSNVTNDNKRKEGDGEGKTGRGTGCVGSRLGLLPWTSALFPTGKVLYCSFIFATLS